MSKSPDIEKIEAALKRAAHKALYGSREERSGRFLRREVIKLAHGGHDAQKHSEQTKPVARTRVDEQA